MVNITEKIKEIEEEMKRTQKNKATGQTLETDHKMFALTAIRISFRSIEGVSNLLGYGHSYWNPDQALAEQQARDLTCRKVATHVSRWSAFLRKVCPPRYRALTYEASVGKSTFLSKVTKTKSEAAAYSFTTLTAIPGVLEYGGAEIQILDLPGIIEGASEGKGRGRQTSDMVLMILDATKRAEQRALLEAELEAVGIRLNKEPPNIYLKQKKAGGMKITFQAPPKKVDEKMLYNILRDYKMLNCEVLVRDENVTVDDFIDVIMRDHRTYIKCLYAYNKVDAIGIEHMDKLAREPNTVVMSCELDLGVQDVVERCWEELRLIRIYTKRKGIEPDFSEALIVRNNSTIEDVCDSIHRTLKESFKYALVWGASARHIPQRVGLGHVVADEDVVSIVGTKSGLAAK
ncbi:GTP-binding protein 1 [Sphaceloma murrayae]|uniref:GTP-binding protein 1 n=1 Tax=Sphaceloma murrayae TaxID=2082308 RepID=A0A2K1QU88_9PEZI|nr:GTP-binding protein 1 [Sphaceloma murrayae]